MFKRKLSIIVIVLCIIMLLSAIALANDEPFKTKLNLFERLVVMGLLPQTGNFATLKIVIEANMMLGATDEESVLAGLKPDGQGGVVAEYGWLIVPEKEFMFKETLLGIVRATLQRLDDEEKLTMEHYRVWIKFMIVEEKEGE